MQTISEKGPKDEEWDSIVTDPFDAIVRKILHNISRWQAINKSSQVVCLTLTKWLKFYPFKVRFETERNNCNRSLGLRLKVTSQRNV